MKFFRLESPQRANAAEAFSGKGGLFAAGRWNSLGNLAVCASESVSLAYLEVLAHLDTGNSSRDHLLFEIEIPDDLIEIRRAAPLPDGWDLRPPGPASRAVGDRWLAEKRSVALLVPSVIVAQERNALINPLHPKFDLGWVKGPMPFRGDTRLSRGAPVHRKKRLKKSD
ncbi:MAG: RES family NAD+ phosphorylase [Methylacidiphilales bacterium]|nr:RES family NAD+ phosphorylase [Candidatus Methylacidiphilales bacterium]